MAKEFAGLTIRISSRNNYGTIAYYPENDTAALFQRLVGTKTTLPDWALSLLKEAGAHIEEVTPVSQWA
jgi:hypothetical protein